MNEITAVLTHVKTAVDLAKILKNSSSTLAEAEQKLKLAEIISALADVKIEMADVQTLLLDKDAEIQSLIESNRITGNIVFEAPSYFLVDGDDKEGPYCQNCYDTHGNLIRQQEWGSSSVKCFSCDQIFNFKGGSGSHATAVPRAFGRARDRRDRGLIG